MKNQNPIHLTVVGAAGRMGRRLIQAVQEDPRFVIKAGLEKTAANLIQFEHNACPLFTDPDKALASVNAVIDFSAPPACADLALRCADRGLPYLVGSTALGKPEQLALDSADKRVPILVAPNLSIGINVIFELVELATQRLGENFDVEISEMHHRHKRDAPSGTALALAEAVKHKNSALRPFTGRSGTGPARSHEELGIAAIRGGDVTGDHTIYFLGMGERVEITHRATNHDIFVSGALRAIQWLVQQPAGRYSMQDMLSSSTKNS